MATCCMIKLLVTMWRTDSKRALSPRTVMEGDIKSYKVPWTYTAHWRFSFNCGKELKGNHRGWGPVWKGVNPDNGEIDTIEYICVHIGRCQKETTPLFFTFLFLFFLFFFDRLVLCSPDWSCNLNLIAVVFWVQKWQTCANVLGSESCYFG